MISRGGGKNEGEAAEGTRGSEKGGRGAPYGSPCSWPAAHGGRTVEHMNIPEGLQLVESPYQCRFFLTAAAVHGQISGAEEV